MKTDTSERGLERLICTALAGNPCDPPSAGTVGEPGLIGSCSIPMQFAAMGQPVSVCHQWSTTGLCRIWQAQ